MTLLARRDLGQIDIDRPAGGKNIGRGVQRVDQQYPVATAPQRQPTAPATSCRKSRRVSWMQRTVSGGCSLQAVGLVGH